MHAFVARSPQTSQSCSAAAEGGGGGGSAVVAADEELGADADTPAGEGGTDTAGDVAEVGEPVAALDGADADADASGEGGGGEGVSFGNAGDVADVDGTAVTALDGFPPFFFVMVGVWVS